MGPTSSFLLGVALKGSAILALTGIVALIVRRASAETRHLVWSVGLGAMLIVPVLSLALPRWPVVRMPGIASPVVAAVAVPAPVAVVPAIEPAFAVTVIQPAQPVQPTQPAQPAQPIAAAAPRAPQVVATTRSIAPAAPRAWTIKAVRTPAVPPAAQIAQPLSVGPTAVFQLLPSLEMLVAVWFGGTLALLLWIGLGEVSVRRLGRQMRPARSPEWTALIPEALEASGVRRRVRILETDRAIVPLTYGLVNPVVVLPTAGREWSASHRRDVLLHELAHVRRHDCLTDLVARISWAVHWFNPLAWVAIRRLRIEREHACDDAVLNAGALPSRYAEELLTTVHSMRGTLGLGAAGLGMATRSQLADRLESVLDATRQRAPLAAWAIAGMVAVSAAVVVPLAAISAAPASDRASPATPATPDTPNARPTPASGEPTLPPVETTPISAAIAPEAPLAALPPSQSDVAANVMGDFEPSSRLVATTAPTLAGGFALAPRVPMTTAQSSSVCPMDNTGRGRKVQLNSSMSISGQGNASDGKNSYVAWTGADCTVVIHTTGTIKFTEDEREVMSISSGGRFAIKHEEGRSEREYTVRPSNDGLTHRYLVDGEPQPMDAAFETWRSELVLEYIRRTAYEAERRARRILASQGVNGVLREIELIPGDWAQGIYFRALLKNASIDASAAARLVAQAGRSLESDYELGQVLAAMSPALLENEQVRQGFVAAAGTMESDYESRKVLQSVLQAGAPSGQVINAMLGLATDLESDYELAELLVALAKSGSFTGEFDVAYMTAVRSIESDYEKHRVLSALLAAGSKSPGTLRAGLEAARTIDSDFEAAGWLKEVAGSAALTDELRPAFFAVTATIESSFERRGVLSAVLARRVIGDALVNDLLAAAAGIESDYELATVLLEVVTRKLLTAGTRPAFRRALATLDSSYERQRVLAAVGELET